MNGNVDGKIIDEIKKGNDELKLFIDAVEVRIMLKIDEINRKVVNLEKENQELKDRIEKLERENKKNNIIVFGTERRQQNLNNKEFIEHLNSLLGTTLNENDVNNIYPLGKHKNAPVKLEFISYLKKNDVFKKIRNLKGKNLSITHDLTSKQREIHKILRKHLQIQRQNKENISFIKNEKLYVNDTAYDVDELLDLESTGFPQREARSDPGTPSLSEFVSQQTPPTNSQLKAKQVVPASIAPEFNCIQSASRTTPPGDHQSEQKTVRNSNKEVSNKNQATPKFKLSKKQATGHYQTRKNSGNRKYLY